MARVRRTERTVTIDGRKRKIRKANIAVLVKDAFVEATTEQLRVTAEEAREWSLDRLYAAKPQTPWVTKRTGPVPPARAVVARPRPLRAAPPRDAFDVGPMIAGRVPLRHAHLRRYYVRRKARREEDGRKIIATGMLTHGLEVFRGEQAGIVYYAVRPIVDEHRSGISFRRLWEMMERGTKHVPKRPTWGPVAFQLADALSGSRYRQRLRASALRASLRRIA